MYHFGLVLSKFTAGAARAIASKSKSHRQSAKIAKEKRGEQQTEEKSRDKAHAPGPSESSLKDLRDWFSSRRSRRPLC
jgi:hypothetical protein